MREPPKLAAEMRRRNRHLGRSKAVGNVRNNTPELLD